MMLNKYFPSFCHSIAARFAIHFKHAHTLYTHDLTHTQKIPDDQESIHPQGNRQALFIRSMVKHLPFPGAEIPGFRSRLCTSAPPFPQRTSHILPQTACLLHTHERTTLTILSQSTLLVLYGYSNTVINEVLNIFQ